MKLMSKDIYGLRASSISLTWEPVRKTGSWTPDLLNLNRHFDKIPR